MTIHSVLAKIAEIIKVDEEHIVSYLEDLIKQHKSDTAAPTVIQASIAVNEPEPEAEPVVVAPAVEVESPKEEPVAQDTVAAAE